MLPCGKELTWRSCASWSKVADFEYGEVNAPNVVSPGGDLARFLRAHNYKES